MVTYLNPTALLSIIAGILILVRPALLDYIVALYLIIIGILALWASDRGHRAARVRRELHGKNIEPALALIVGILILIQPTLLGLIWLSILIGYPNLQTRRQLYE